MKPMPTIRLYWPRSLKTGTLSRCVAEDVVRADPQQADQEAAQHADHDAAAAAERGRGVGGDDQAEQDRAEADHVVPLLQVGHEAGLAGLGRRERRSGRRARRCSSRRSRRCRPPRAAGRRRTARDERPPLGVEEVRTGPGQGRHGCSSAASTNGSRGAVVHAGCARTRATLVAVTVDPTRAPVTTRTRRRPPAAPTSVAAGAGGWRVGTPLAVLLCGGLFVGQRPVNSEGTDLRPGRYTDLASLVRHRGRPVRRPARAGRRSSTHGGRRR